VVVGGVVGFGAEDVDGEGVVVVLPFGRVTGEGCAVGGEDCDEGGESTGIAMLEVNSSREADISVHHAIPFSTACSGALRSP
jgi:hypothetical protein